MKDKLEISLRPVVFSDIEFLWFLRNQPETFEYSKNKSAVAWQEHINWIMPIILKQNNKELFVVENSKLPVGQIRFDYGDKNSAEISISILKQFWGKGTATKALELALESTAAGRITAIIHKNNLASQKFFKKFNFKLDGKKRNWLTYIYGEI